MEEPSQDITSLLEKWARGERQAALELVPVVYPELRRLAAGMLGGNWRQQTLQPTELVHEAYLNLFGREQPGCADRKHFFALAAKTMRHILVDHARQRAAAKRGGGAIKVPLEIAGPVGYEPSFDVLALDRALVELEALDPLKASIVELHFFGGLTVAETAASVERSTATVTRHWRLAKAWLFRELAG